MALTLTEPEARLVLEMHESPAAGIEYEAIEVDEGWVFMWDEGRGPARSVTPTWVVAHNGKVTHTDPRNDKGALTLLRELAHA
jgi:hypothetical protein